MSFVRARPTIKEYLEALEVTFRMDHVERKFRVDYAKGHSEVERRIHLKCMVYSDV
jgi:hypothetical protein